ncbi:MAG TPA: right-handed parallel beta-helix repeat-containing protein [Thermoanaerobaculia bacterium]|nr:right-handed parallel beta-helix repeat-containing protein [Thermoanaerobaculia bacterium]
MSPSRRIAAAGTDPGRERENNEDRVLCEPERGIFAVVDGVGGESGGEVASQIATDVLRARLSRRTTDLDRLVREAIALANRQIFERAQTDPRLAGMSCVLTVALLDGGPSGETATVGHVGDSRLYLLRRGEIKKVTRDHSPVGTREDSGEISEDEAMHHPRRNEIFRDVGSAPHEPDDQGFVEIHQIPFDADSALLICSDGLSDLVPSARIRQAVEAHAGDPQAAIDQLIDEANEAGGKDNISIVIVEGERYAQTVRGAAALDDTRSGVPVSKPAPKQYGAAHTKERSVLPWILLLLVLAAAAGAWFYPPVRERLLKLIDRQEDPAPTPTPAPVLHVGPGEADFLSISDALAEARPGQTIEVAPGQYQETVELKDGVALVSRTPRGAVIQAPDAAPAVSGRGVRTRLVGFKIEGGAVGLLLEGAQVEVSEVEVTGAAEAGIAVSGADRSSIEACYVHDNTGTGIVVDGGAATRVRQNLIARNGTKTPKRPGIEVRGQARPLLIENRIEGNGAAGVWIPTAERTDEILQWNQFGRASRSQAVRVSPTPAPTPGGNR